MTRRAGLVIIAALAAVVAVLAGTAAFVSGNRLPPAPPATGAGSGTVTISFDAARHPSGPGIKAQLQRHFDAINSRDYETWRSTVVEKRAALLPEARWREAYASTTDGTIHIDRIDPADAGAPEGSLVVRLRFVSTQNLSDAPEKAKSPRVCWLNSWPMEGTPPRIGMTRGDPSSATAC